jgi:prephenate dehydrogenase
MTLSRPLVLGANGGMGALFSERLSREGMAVTGIDLYPRARDEAGVNDYLSADITRPDEAVRAAVEAADCILLAVPHNVALAALPALLPWIAPGALLVDTLSVKTEVVGRLRAAGRTDIDILSINPMFAPGLGFAGQKVVVVEVATGARARAFLDLLRSWEASVFPVSAEEHDRMMAAIQVATHSALLAFGLALRELSCDVERCWPLASPPHRVCLALLARIASAAPHVYWDIQRDNPSAAEARRAVANGLQRLARIVETDDLSAFGTLLEETRNTLEPQTEQLRDLCVSLFEVCRSK